MENKLINIENKNGEMVVSSREVASNFGKRHTEVLRTIEDKIGQNAKLRSDNYFIETSYKAGTGKEYKEFLMTRDGFSFLVMGFTGRKADEWKIKYIEAFNKMEEYIKSTPKTLPTNFKEALQQLLVEVEEKEKLQLEIKELEPKAKFAETIVSNEKSIDVGSMAKLLKQNGIDTGRTRLFSILRENGFLMSSGDDTVPTQKSMNLEVMETKLGTYVVNGETKNLFKTYDYNKRTSLFYEKIFEGRIIMKQEKIVSNKNYDEITFGEMCDCEAKWDFICNGDKKGCSCMQKKKTRE